MQLAIVKVKKEGTFKEDEELLVLQGMNRNFVVKGMLTTSGWEIYLDMVYHVNAYENQGLSKEKFKETLTYDSVMPLYISFDEVKDWHLASEEDIETSRASFYEALTI